MDKTTTLQANIVRTERGLTITGTRITLYDVMDYLTQAWPPELIQYWLNLTEAQITAAIAYIHTHQAEVEAEYQEVLQYAEEMRQYWEAENRERLAQIAALQPQPGQEKLWEKLQQWKARLKAA